MDKTSYRILTLTVGCMLLLSAAAQQVIAWPCPPCPDCYTCTRTGCEYDCGAGQTCCGGKTCSGCCYCSNCSCVNGSCSGCCECISCGCLDVDDNCGTCEACNGCTCEDLGCDCTEPESEWNDITGLPSCSPGEGPTKLWSNTDECENTLEVWCRGYYSFEHNGTVVGTCVYDNGLNVFKYKKTANGDGFHSTWHRSRDPDHDGSAADEGTKYKYDWVVWTYDSIGDPGSPCEHCREADTWSDDYGESDGDPSDCE